MASAQPWNQWATDQLKRYCYAPDGVAPTNTTLAQDLRWVKYRLTVMNDSRERIELAMRGAPLVWLKLQGSKWSPAKVMSKKGSWVNLFDRSITAAGRAKAHHPDTPPLFRQVFKAIAESM